MSRLVRYRILRGRDPSTTERLPHPRNCGMFILRSQKNVMLNKPIVVVTLILASTTSFSQAPTPKASVTSPGRKVVGPTFMGRKVIITEPEIEDGMFPKGPATVCLEGPPQRQCFSAG